MRSAMTLTTAILLAAGTTAYGQTGACCLPSGCALLGGEDCSTAGGVYWGDGTLCDVGRCNLFPEAEPNNNKAQANEFTLAHGDGITGTTTAGTGTGDPGSPDYFRIKTAPAPLGLYKHRLLLTNSTPFNTTWIRGLTQSPVGAGTWPCGLGAATGTESIGQNHITEGDTRVQIWYGFGKGEEVYYRIAGTASSTGQYTALLETTPLAPPHLGTFQAGMIAISTAGQGHSNDTHLRIYDANFDAIPGYSNSRGSINGGFTNNSAHVSYLRRQFGPGTYHMAITIGNLATAEGAPCDDHLRDGVMMDLPDGAMNTAGLLTAFDVSFTMTDSNGTTSFPAERPGRREVAWFTFDVAGTIPFGACCLTEGNCIMEEEFDCILAGGHFQGDGTTCSTIPPCPTFITTTYLGAVNTSVSGAGTYFLAKALDPAGISVESFDINCIADAGTTVTVHVYVRPDNFVDYRLDPSAWVLLGQVETISAGPVRPTPVPIGGLYIPHEEMWAFRVGTANGGFRFSDNPMTTPIHANSHVELHMGEVQQGFFGGLRLGNYPTNLRGWNGTVWYSTGNTVPTGACCLPDGTCLEHDAVSCGWADGVYQGDGTDCTTVPPCAQPGACCYQWGVGCDVMAEWQCDRVAEATYQSNGSTCQACPPPGACCLADGSCVYVTAPECTSLFGGFWTAAANCGEGRCATAPMLWNHGPLLTDLAIGCEGNDISAVQSQLGNTTNGIDWRGTASVADQFIIPDGEAWNITGVRLFGYDADVAPHLYTGVFIRIWDGPPGDSGSTVVAGDATTNRLTAAALSDLYRASVSAPAGCTRRLQDIDAAFEATLSAGTYWIERSAAIATTTRTPWVPFVSYSGLSGKPGAAGMQFASGSWGPRGDAGSGVRQDMPFILFGTVASDCYANCDGSTTEPVLNVEDFVCFINMFADGTQLADPQAQIEHYANCDGSTTTPVLNVEDFICFINRFAQGC
jgi:hypothetical protein